jgi:uncharacterized protein YdcH (DUF465 family)
MTKLSFPFTAEKIRARKAGDEVLICKSAGFGFNSIMSKLEQVEDQVKRLSVAEQEALRDWLENLLEDRLELKDEFKAEIEAGKKDIADGR